MQLTRFTQFLRSRQPIGQRLESSLGSKHAWYQGLSIRCSVFPGQNNRYRAESQELCHNYGLFYVCRVRFLMVKSFNFNVLLILLVSFPYLALGADEAVPADSTLEQDMGYFYGFSFGNMLKDGGSPDVDVESLLKGLNDSLAGNPPALADDRREKVYQEVRDRQLRTQEAKKAVQDAQEEAALVQVETNLANAEAFLMENATREGVKTTPSGLQYEVLVDAGGKRPAATSRVSVNYVGSFIDGSVFDQSGDKPVEFGLEQVVAGWTEGLQLMGIGDKFRFYLHPDLAYGAGSVGPIPPNSLLVFDVELLDIR